MRAVIAEVVPLIDVAKLPAEMPFTKTDIDSLDHMSILIALHERFGLFVPDEDLSQTTSIASIVDYAARHPPCS